jgi:hypothetical protein
MKVRHSSALVFGVSILISVLISAAALAEENLKAESSATLETSLFSMGRFHFFSSICKSEAGESEELETTPQSPPLNVDDPGTPGCNKWEINFVVDGDVTKDERSWELPLLDINYGIGDNLQLKYEVPNLNAQTTETNTSQVGNSKAGIKYQFYGLEESKTQIAFYPQVEFATPNSSQAKPEDQGTITTLPILFSTTIGKAARGDVNMSLNLGYNLSSRISTADFISAALGLGMPLIKRVAILAELTTEQAVALNPDGIRQHLVKMDIGAVGPINKHFLAFGSVGRSVMSSDEHEHTYVLGGLRLLADGF